jgi:hypothetical protein
VWPSPEFSEISPVSTSSPGIRALVRDDLPTGLADEDADLVGQGGFQLIEPFTALAAYQQHLVTELAVGLELALDTGAGRVIEHVDLVQHDEGRYLHILGGHQVAVDDVGGELGHHRRDDDDLVDVGGDGLTPS